jgi:hypothetical protein
MRSGGEEVTVDSLLWRSPAHCLRAEDGAGQRGAGLQVNIYMQKEVGRNIDAEGSGTLSVGSKQEKEVVSSLKLWKYQGIWIFLYVKFFGKLLHHLFF